jgi:DNA-binding LytR/AlgR family response regulator
VKNAEVVNILIVESEKEQMQFLENALQQSGLNVFIVAAVDDIDFLTEVKKIKDLDIIVIDLRIFKKTRNKFDFSSPLIYTVVSGQEEEFEIDENVIGILDKPFKEKEIIKILKRFIKIKEYFFDQFNSKIFSYQKAFTEKKDRFVVRKGKENTVVRADEIAYIYNENRLTFIVDTSGNKFFLDQPLVKIQRFLDPSSFFRVSRKYLVNINSIKKFRSYDKSKIHLIIDPEPSESVVVSSSSVAEFRKWIGEESI